MKHWVRQVYSELKISQFSNSEIKKTTTSLSFELLKPQEQTCLNPVSKLVSFKDNGQWRLWSKSLLDYHMALHNQHCWFLQFYVLLDPLWMMSPLRPQPSPCWKEIRKGGRRKKEPVKEVNMCELGVLAPAGLPGKGTDLASHHTQPASAYVWACMWVHLLARECVSLCVTGRAHKERRIVSKERIRKDNGERVRRQGKIKERVLVKNTS